MARNLLIAALMRLLLVMSSTLCSFLFTCRPAEACQCTSQAPRLLIPARGLSHAPGAPLLIAHSIGAYPVLFDPSGARVELIAAWRGGGAEPCGATYELFVPATPQVDGMYRLLLTDSVFADVPYQIDVKHDRVGIAEVEVAVAVSREAVETYQGLSGACAPSLSGATITGEVRGTVSLSRAVAAFVEVTVADPTFSIRTFRSNLERGTSTPPQTVDFSAPVTAQGSGCVTIAVFDWQLSPVWSEYFCLDAGGSGEARSLTWFATAGFPDEVEREFPEGEAASSNCSVAHRRQAGSAWVWGVAALASVGLRRFAFATRS